MRVWLDDIRPMPEGFDVHVKTFDEAKKLLLAGKVTKMSFDHDLGGEKNPLGSPPGKSGYALAQWVEEAAYFGKLPKFEWEVHSMNPAGGQMIKRALMNADKYWAGC